MDQGPKVAGPSYIPPACCVDIVCQGELFTVVMVVVVVWNIGVDHPSGFLGPFSELDLAWAALSCEFGLELGLGLWLVACLLWSKTMHHLWGNTVVSCQDF